jgi:hypothetical protein
LPRHTTYADISKTAFAFDYWRNNELPLDQLKKIIKPLNSALVILEVLEPSISQKAQWEINADQQMIRDDFGEDVALSFATLHTEHVPEALDKFVKSHQVDILALCAQNQTFMERIFHKSLIKEMSRLATYPLLIVHA